MGFYEYVNALDEILDKLLVFRIFVQKNKHRQKRLKNESKTKCKKKKVIEQQQICFCGLSTLFRLFKNKYLKSKHILRYKNNSYFLRVNITLIFAVE